MGRINAQSQSSKANQSTLNRNDSNYSNDSKQSKYLTSLISRFKKYGIIRVALTLISLCFFILFFTSSTRSKIKSFQFTKLSDNDNDDKCSAFWRPDNLNTPCTGLTKVTAENNNDYQKEITSADECKAFCCEMGDKCVTWQWQGSGASRGCHFGGAVKLGSEVADTTNSCPAALKEWEGQRVQNKTDDAAALRCSFEDENLTTQCHGLNPFFFSQGGLRVNFDSSALCQRKCCMNEKCKIWQFNKDDGCFIGESTTFICEDPWVGGRKCIKGFCGGLENKILKSS